MELKIETRNLDLRKGWKEKIEEEKAKLIRNYAGFVLRLRVSIESTSNYKEGGCEVKLVASVPNDTVVVKRWGENVRPLLIEAFDVLGLQLKSINSKKQNKKGAKSPVAAVEGDFSGVVKKVFPEESYGFIITADDMEVFFHENSLKDLSMGDLTEGDAVFMNISEGEKGPQATWVRAAKV